MQKKEKKEKAQEQWTMWADTDASEGREEDG